MIDRQSGFSLVELMIALTIGLIMISSALTFFIQAKRSYSENEKILNMQDDARFALLELTRDIAAVGFWGELSNFGSVTSDTSLTIDDDCGPPAESWVYDFSNQLETLDNADGTAAAARFNCINSAVVQPGTDLISIKRTAGNTATALSAGNVYVKSNGIVGLLFEHPQDSPPAVEVPAPAEDWLYTPSIWYVRNHASESNRNDGIPALCRKFLDTSGTPSMVEECLARGIEDLQFEFGVDTDGDSSADQYVADPDPALMSRVVSVRVFLLVRSMEPQTGYHNRKTYQLSNRPLLTPDDNYFRRVYTATVTTRNLRNQAIMGL